MKKKSTALLVAIILILQFFMPFGTSSVTAAELKDVDNHWANKEIKKLISMGVINGYEDNTFRPGADVTRGAFAAFLVRALQLPEGTDAFKDVPKTSRLYKEIAAAKKAGIILGTADGKALPDEKITRADAAVMIDRTMQLKGNYTETTELTYEDAGSVPKYALESIKRMTHYKIILGTSENRIDARSTATRAQSAVFIYRMLDLLDLLDEDGEEPPAVDPVPSAPGNASNINPSHIKVDLGDGNEVQVKMNNAGVPLTYIKKRTTTHINSTDHHYDYHLGKASNPLGKFTLTLRRIDNGDTFIFTKFVHNGDNNYTAAIILPFSDIERTKMQRIDSYGKVKQEHNGTFGVNPTSHPIGMLEAVGTDGSVKSMMLSKNYTSVHREAVYSSSRKSVIREFKEEHESYQANLDPSSKKLNVNLNMKVTSKNISESWVMLSNEELFQQQKYVDYWFQKSVLEFESLNSWYTEAGPYTKLPWSIEPGYQMGFGRNLGQVQGGIYLTAYNGSKERYFYNLVMNSIADLDVFSNGAITKGDVPVFQTEYTSTWLKKAYGTEAPYIDTRLNENAALFLQNAGQIFDIPQLSNANEIYANFLVQQKEIGNIIKVTQSTHLIADYYSPKGKTTHVSLNHALGEMRFLLETYRTSKNEKYLKTARELQGAIEYLYPRWVRPNGDLWYQVNGKLEFTGNDYQWLTLVDLLLSQQLFEDMGMKRSAIFDQMITTKTTYLVNNKLEIKDMAIKLLVEQGFGSLIDGYTNISAASAVEEEINEKSEQIIEELYE